MTDSPETTPETTPWAPVSSFLAPTPVANGMHSPPVKLYSDSPGAPPLPEPPNNHATGPSGNSGSLALTSTSLESFTLEARTREEALKNARLLASSDLVPKDFKNKPENVLIAVQLGRELGFGPVQSLQNIAIVNGRPCIWGDMFWAIVIGNPQCEDWWDREIGERGQDSWGFEVTLKRRGRTAISRSFTLGDARLAGLWGKTGPWQTNPARMLSLRARAFAGRDVFADALRGIMMREEVEDYPVRVRTASVTASVTSSVRPGPSVEASSADPVEAVFEAIDASGSLESLNRTKALIAALPSSAQGPLRAAFFTRYRELKADSDALAESRGVVSAS